MAWQDYYSSLAGGIPLYQPNLLATLQALRTPMPEMPMPQQQPQQQQGGGINLSGAKNLIDALRSGSGSSEATRANAVHSLGPISSSSVPLASSGLGQAQATEILTAPAAYGTATGTGSLGGISGASVTGGAEGAGLGGGAVLRNSYAGTGSYWAVLTGAAVTVAAQKGPDWVVVRQAVEVH